LLKREIKIKIGTTSLEKCYTAAKKDVHGNSLRSSCKKIAIDVEWWLLDDPCNSEMT
jgi:hypothetical protein